MKFLTCYFPNEIDIDSIPPASFAKNIGQKTKWLLRTIVSVLEIKATINLDYASIENRKVVTEHLRRERSKALAEIVKRRDGFTCRVCDFNFSDNYGDWGRGFAEAHHILALSKLERKTKTTHKDLITVCANCHRMLHRMEGKADDFKELRKLFIKNRRR